MRLPDGEPLQSLITNADDRPDWPAGTPVAVDAPGRRPAVRSPSADRGRRVQLHGWSDDHARLAAELATPHRRGTSGQTRRSGARRRRTRSPRWPRSRPAGSASTRPSRSSTTCCCRTTSPSTTRSSSPTSRPRRRRRPRCSTPSSAPGRSPARAGRRPVQPSPPRTPPSTGCAGSPGCRRAGGLLRVRRLGGQPQRPRRRPRRVAPAPSGDAGRAGRRLRAVGPLVGAHGGRAARPRRRRGRRRRTRPADRRRRSAAVARRRPDLRRRGQRRRHQHRRRRRPRRRRRRVRRAPARGCTSTPPTAAPPCACPSWPALFAGIERADSLVIDPHKWLFAPLDCAAAALPRPGRGGAHPPPVGGVPRGVRRRARQPVRPRLPPHPADARACRSGSPSSSTAPTPSRRPSAPASTWPGRPRRLDRRPSATAGAPGHGARAVRRAVRARRLGAAPTGTRWAAAALADGLAFVAPTRWQGRDVGRLVFLHPRTDLDAVRRAARPHSADHLSRAVQPSEVNGRRLAEQLGSTPEHVGWTRGQMSRRAKSSTAEPRSPRRKTRSATTASTRASVVPSSIAVAMRVERRRRRAADGGVDLDRHGLASTRRPTGTREITKSSIDVGEHDHQAGEDRPARAAAAAPCAAPASAWRRGPAPPPRGRGRSSAAGRAR